MASKLSSLPFSDRLRLFRENLGDLDGFIIPTADAHGSEYIADCDKRREFISGFTGSAGTVVITHHEAILWTDSRYTLQAQTELDLNVWQIIDVGCGPSISVWLSDRFFTATTTTTGAAAAVGGGSGGGSITNDPQLQQPSTSLSSSIDQFLPSQTETITTNSSDNSNQKQQQQQQNTSCTINKPHALDNNKKILAKIGCDPNTISFYEWENYNSYLKMRGISLICVDNNIVDKIWIDRPLRPSNSLIILPPNFTGMFWSEKVRRVCTEMKKMHCDALLISALDEIAWLLNLRGSDIAYNPVFFSYVIVTEDGVHIFLDDYKLRATPGIVDHLTSTKIKTFLYDYTKIQIELNKMCTTIEQAGKLRFIWCNSRTSAALVGIVPKRQRYLSQSPVEIMKMVKTPEEINGIRKAHVQDAIAVCRYLQYLEENVDHTVITEVSGAAKLDSFRAEESDFVSLSFPTISGYGANGAIIHYHAHEESTIQIGRHCLYLVDSGGQYHTGTTDVTRTIHLGSPSEEERRNFTLVLKGHINLCRVVFPENTKGSALDSFARRPLWRAGLNYGHGTGHGVGAFLNVHEGPCGIFSPSRARILQEESLKANTVITIEPGYYREGAYGIRIENVVLVSGSTIDTTNGQLLEGFLHFEPITFVPIQTRLIMKSLLTTEEVQWMNDYHQLCRQVLAPHLLERNLTAVHDWLLSETQPL